MRPNKNGRGEGAAKGLAELKRLRKQAEAQAALAPPAIQASGPATQAARPRRAAAAAGQSLTAADIALFRRAVSMVTPIKDTHRSLLPPVPAAPAELMRQRRQRAMGSETPSVAKLSDHFHPALPESDDSRFVRDRHAADLIKGLKRGKWPVGAVLDLHGCTLNQAQARLDRFLASCVDHQIRCVRIVHGKGYGSLGEPVLKQTIRRWLAQLACVLAYTECAEQDGGAGAVQVLLHAAPVPPASEGSVP